MCYSLFCCSIRKLYEFSSKSDSSSLIFSSSTSIIHPSDSADLLTLDGSLSASLLALTTSKETGANSWAVVLTLSIDNY